jgi:hypothetical protein
MQDRRINRLECIGESISYFVWRAITAITSKCGAPLQGEAASIILKRIFQLNKRLLIDGAMESITFLSMHTSRPLSPKALAPRDT